MAFPFSPRRVRRSALMPPSVAVARRAILAGLGRELTGSGPWARARIGVVGFAVGRDRVSDREGRVTDVLAGVRVLDFGRYIAGPYCAALDRKSTRLNSGHVAISYAVFCLKNKR